MDLKELLGEELANQVTAKLGDNKLIINGIPKPVFNEELEKVKSLKAQIEQYEANIKVLKESALGNETLTKQITELQKANKEVKEKFDAEQAVLKKSFAIKEALLAEGVQDEEARNLLSLKFDVAKVELDEQGKIKGFSDTVKPIKENPAFKGMFGQTVMQGTQHRQGDSSSPISELEQKLTAAQKAGRLAEVVAIRNQLVEQQKT